MTIGGRILITGGTGSIGHAIIERAEREGWPAEFVVYSRDEVKQAAMADAHPGVRFRLGDVQDADALGRSMRGVDVVIHAAAYKRVPEAERETMACVGANVVGSMVVLKTALQSSSVHTVIGISTDKACSPINAYGQSKALMERLFQSAARGSDVRFVLTRYGNVLASRGSVIPALRAQAAAGGPITITDPAMTRFWLTLDDAVDLIVAAAHAPTGTITIPRSDAATMATVAEAVAPGVPTRVVGVRDGEKRHEELLNVHEGQYCDASGPHLRLWPMSGPPTFDMVRYRSDEAPRIPTIEFAAIVAAMDRGEPVRTLTP